MVTKKKRERKNVTLFFLTSGKGGIPRGGMTLYNWDRGRRGRCRRAGSPLKRGGVGNISEGREADPFNQPEGDAAEGLHSENVFRRRGEYSAKGGGKEVKLSNGGVMVRYRRGVSRPGKSKRKRVNWKETILS